MTQAKQAEGHPVTSIQILARKAAKAGLNLRDARWLFDVLYCTDALAQTHGNHTKAAHILGVGRVAVCRLRKKHEVNTPIDGET